MIGWLARGILLVAGVITSWFVARDDATFAGLQAAVGLLLLVLVVFIVAFWPARWAFKRRRHPN
jgi:hypothetical protein